jgi:hypothetical protein
MARQTWQRRVEVPPSLEEDTSAGSGGGWSRSGGQRSGGDQRRRPSGLRKSGSESRLRGDVEAQPTVRYARAGPGGGESGSSGYQVRGRPPVQIRAMTRRHSSDAAHVATTTGGGGGPRRALLQVLVLHSNEWGKG